MGLGSKLISGISSVGTKIVGAVAGAIGLTGLAGGSVKALESNMSFASGETGGGEEGLVEGDKDKTEVSEKRSIGNRILGLADRATFNLLDLDKKGGEMPFGARVFGGILDAVTGNRFDFDRKNSVEADDLTFKDINQLKESISANSAAIQTIVNPSPQSKHGKNSPVAVPKNRPQVTYTAIKTTQPAIPFIKTLGNQYLSLSPHTNKLPPEIARMIQ